MLMPTLVTRRLILRTFAESDAKDMFEYAKNPNVGPMAGWTPHKDEGESLAIIQKMIERECVWAICDKKNGKVIGSIGLHGSVRRLKTYKVMSMGYVLSQDYWGQGLMPEACSEVMHFAFECLKLDLIEIGHYDFNNRSRRVIEKLGFTADGLLKNCYELDGKLYAEHFYSMFRSQYEQIHIKQ